ncbi:MAG: hypothetical protein HYZ81_08805 [Nitrospinae bacterium]|nr:hypothetical protein [Nitrospinota bacterium]
MAVPRKPEPRLIITQVNVLEGSNFFTLDVGCYLQVPEQQPPQPPNIPCQIAAAEAADHILVQPKVDVEVVAGTGRFRLVGAFAPRTTYAITFLPGLRGEGQVVSGVSKEAEEGRAAGRATVQAILTEPVSRSIQTPGLKPRLQFLGRARYLPRLQGATLPFEARNVQHVRVSFRQIFPQNLIFWLSKGHDAASSRWMPQDREAASDDVAEEVRHVDLDCRRSRMNG